MAQPSSLYQTLLWLRKYTCRIVLIQEELSVHKNSCKLNPRGTKYVFETMWSSEKFPKQGYLKHGIRFQYSQTYKQPLLSTQWKFCMHFDTMLPYKTEVWKNILISLRRAVKILCQISGEKIQYLKKKKKLKQYNCLIPHVWLQKQVGFLQITLFPSTRCHRKQRIKISRYLKNKILMNFFFLLVDYNCL